MLGKYSRYEHLGTLRTQKKKNHTHLAQKIKQYDPNHCVILTIFNSVGTFPALELKKIKGDPPILVLVLKK